MSKVYADTYIFLSSLFVKPNRLHARSNLVPGLTYDIWQGKIICRLVLLIMFTKYCGQLLCAVTGPGSLVSSGKETSKILQKFMDKFNAVSNTNYFCFCSMFYFFYFFQITRATAWPEKIENDSISEAVTRMERAMIVALGQCQNSCCLSNMAI